MVWWDTGRTLSNITFWTENYIKLKEDQVWTVIKIEKYTYSVVLLDLLDEEKKTVLLMLCNFNKKANVSILYLKNKQTLLTVQTKLHFEKNFVDLFLSRTFWKTFWAQNSYFLKQKKDVHWTDAKKCFHESIYRTNLNSIGWSLNNSWQ